MKSPAQYTDTAHMPSSRNLKMDHTRLLYSAIPFSVVSHIILASILVIVQRELISIELLLSWYIVLMLVLLTRVILNRKWNHAGNEAAANIVAWLWWFRGSVLATGIVWGVAGVLLIPVEDISHQFFVSFVLGGLCAGAMTSLSVDRISITGFLLPVLVPHIIYLFMLGGTITLGMSTMLTLFILFMFFSARQAGQTLHDNIQLRLQASEDETRFRMMLDYSPIAAAITDFRTQQVVFANQSYADLIGQKKRFAINISPWELYAMQSEYADVLQHLDSGERITNRLIELTPHDGSKKNKWVLASYLQINYQGKPMILNWFYDITDRKVMEEHAQHQAYHDPLTGLPNRILFRDRIHQALSIAERDDSCLAVLFIDLDGFKWINDTHGHDTGDLLLKAAARRISNCLRKSDSIARFGGDEFMVLLPFIKENQSALEVAEKIRLAIKQTFTIENHPLNIGSSIGIAIYPDHGREEALLIRRADIAMYYAKSAGRNNAQLYSEAMEYEHHGHLAATRSD